MTESIVGVCRFPGAFAVQIFRGILSPREIEMPSRTFLNWYKRADYTAYAFNTRPVMRNPCQKPFVFYLSRARLEESSTRTVSVYLKHNVSQPECKWNLTDPEDIVQVEVYKKPDPHLWDWSPRRNCCRVRNSTKKSMVIDVGKARLVKRNTDACCHVSTLTSSSPVY